MARAIKEITVLTPSGTNISGFVPYASLDFVEEVQVWRGAAHLVLGLTAAAFIDVIPGTNPATGDIQLTAGQPALLPGEVLVMQTFTLYETAIAAPKYDAVTKTFTCFIWAEQKGQLIVDPDQADLSIRIGTAAPLHNFSPNLSPTADGVFTFTHNDLELPPGEVYILDVSVEVAGKTIATKRGFSLG